MNEPDDVGVTPWLRGVAACSAYIWIFAFSIGLIIEAWHAHILAPGRKHEQFVAVQKLQANHRIVDGDIAEAGLWHPFFLGSLTTRDDFVGRYIKDCVNDQDPVEIEQTLSGPNLTTKRLAAANPQAKAVKAAAQAGNAVVWVSLADLPAADIATLDVHRTLDVCNIDGHEKCGEYAVEAIACTGKQVGAATCSAAVQITAEQRRRLFSAIDKAALAPKSVASPKAESTANPDAAAGTLISTVHLAIHRYDESTHPRVDVTCAPTARSR